MAASPLRRDLLAGTLAGALANAGLAAAHSLRTRGARDTLTLAGLILGPAALAEGWLVNRTGKLRHRSQPQVFGIPIPAFCGWYTIIYASESLTERLLDRAGLPDSARHWATPLGAALLATSLDLIFDPYCLAQGLWEWRDGGPYAAEVAGPNDGRGIPVANSVLWLSLTGCVTALSRRLTGSGSVPQGTPAGPSQRATIGVLLAYYLPAAGWALWRRQPRYLLYSALVPATVAAALLADRAG